MHEIAEAAKKAADEAAKVAADAKAARSAASEEAAAKREHSKQQARDSMPIGEAWLSHSIMFAATVAILLPTPSTV